MTLTTDQAAPVEHVSFVGRVVRGQVQAGAILLLLIGLIVATGIHSSLFFGVNNIKVQLENMSYIAIAGVGTAILIITGNVDLSIGSLLGFTAVVSGMLAEQMPIALAFILAIMIGGGVSAIMGTIVWNVPTSPIIITLGGLLLIRGIVVVITGGIAVNVPSGFSTFGNLTPLGIPMPVWMFVGVALLGFLFLTFTTTGRHIYAIGGNKEAARAAGIRVRRITIGAYVVSGLLVGLTGVLEASSYGSADDTFGVNFELQVLTAVIVGGVSFAGGEGGILRAMLGCALLEVVGAAVVFFGIDPNWASIITGTILIVAVSMDQIVHKQRERYQKAMAMRDLARITEERRQAAGDDPLSDAPMVTY